LQQRRFSLAVKRSAQCVVGIDPNLASWRSDRNDIRITLCKPMPEQATLVKARAARARLRRLAALTNIAYPGV
jgi:hypothetical protein